MFYVALKCVTFLSYPQVVYDECQEVEKRVPVDICKRRRFNEDSIFLSKGKLFRKEGEVRRKTLFRRPFKFDSQSNSTSQSIALAPIKPSSFNVEDFDTDDTEETSEKDASNNREL